MTLSFCIARLAGRPVFYPRAVGSRRVRVRDDVVRFLDSYASLLVLLLANFFLLELVDSRRWGSVGSTLLGAAALVVAISEPATGHTIRKRDGVLIVIAVGLSLLLLFTTSNRLFVRTHHYPLRPSRFAT